MSEAFQRPDDRQYNQLRRTRITLGVMKHAEGSVLVEFGDTRVLCTVSVEDRVPQFRVGSGLGWLTAEYSMLPRATETRNQRDSTRGRPNGRSLEIGRLIGRALRAAVDFKALGERTLWVDCDVIQADGGTRTAAITGSFVALVAAMVNLKRRNRLKRSPLKCSVAAVSVGIVEGTPILDLNYPEDRDAEADINVVMTGDGRIIEIQGTAEADPFSQEDFAAMFGLAQSGIMSLTEAQKKAIESINRDDIWAGEPAL